MAALGPFGKGRGMPRVSHLSLRKVKPLSTLVRECCFGGPTTNQHSSTRILSSFLEVTEVTGVT